MISFSFAESISWERGKDVFEGKGTCYTCHGIKGDGQSDLTSNLPKPPRNFKDKKWQRENSDNAIFYAISKGKEWEGCMPAFENVLESDEIKSLVKYIRKIGSM